MSSELIRAEIGAAIEKVKERGIVIKRDKQHYLVGAYQWRAAVAHLVEDHSYSGDRHTWCTMGCFARFCFGSAHAAKVAMARDRVAPLARELLEHGHILLIAYDGPNGAKSAMRIYRSGDDSQLVRTQLEKMERMRDTSEEKVDHMLSIIEEAEKTRARGG
jgi:hypothetical protein